MSADCKICNGTGERGQYGTLDCAAPGCTAAEERAALNDFIEKAQRIERMTPYDLHWAIYKFAMHQTTKGK